MRSSLAWPARAFAGAPKQAMANPKAAHFAQMCVRPIS
jgi:hypothetical protein